MLTRTVFLQDTAPGQVGDEGETTVSEAVGRDSAR